MKTSFQVPAIVRCALPLLAVVLFPTLAQAHPEVPGHAHGFVGGLAHPFSGPDHICAMIAIGLWAAQRGGRALWAMPLAFITAMVLGGMLGRMAGTLPLMETGIATSVLILGILIAAAIRLPLLMSVLIGGGFALFHGYAHGVEIPATASGLAYELGFILTTAGLQLCGVSFGLAAKRRASMSVVRCAGVAIAASGIYFFIAA